MVATEVQPKTFYARSANLTISAVKPKIEMVDGQLRKHGEKLIEFSRRIGAGRGTHTDNWGEYTTSDPVLIDFLESRMATAGDVFSYEQYQDMTTPAEVKIADGKRTIEEQNRLIAELQAREAARNKSIQPPVNNK